MPKVKDLNAGDIFYVKIFTGKFVVGRILFSIDKQYDKPGLDKQNELPNSLKSASKDTFLIEVFKGFYEDPTFYEEEVLISRALIVMTSIKDFEWGILKNSKVDYATVEFPEVLVNRTEIKLYRGEISFATSVTEEDLVKSKFWNINHLLNPLPYACLYLQGMSDLIEKEFLRKNDFQRSDLLYHPELRNRVYKELDIAPNKSYYELSKDMGFDLKRFYE